jgi:hypothetical protein
LASVCLAAALVWWICESAALCPSKESGENRQLIAAGRSAFCIGCMRGGLSQAASATRCKSPAQSIRFPVRHAQEFDD